MSSVAQNTHKRTRKDGDWMWLQRELIRSHFPPCSAARNWLCTSVLSDHSNNITQATFLHQKTIATLAGCSESPSAESPPNG